MTTGRRRGGGPRPRSGTGQGGRSGGSSGGSSSGSSGGPSAGPTARSREHAPGRRLHAVAEPATEVVSGPPTTPLERPAWTDVPVALAAEDEALTAARARADDRGVGAVGVSTAAVWTFLATRARAAVEIGTGVGVGTLALLRGMPVDGVLTSIDVDAEHQRLARAASTGAGFGAGRLRLITGRALDVLPRLSDAAYDLVVIDAVAVEYPAHLTAALRLLRPGGVVALDRVLGAASLSDPVRRDAASTALRETVRLVRDDERLAPMMLPVGDGVLCAARR